MGKLQGKSSAFEQSEKELQKAVQIALSDPSAVFKTAGGKRLQVLSPGRINVHPGPDFLDVALLLDGLVVVGEAEFHKKSSLWNSHNHSADERYSSVVLHIVLERDTEIDFPFETLVLDGSLIAGISERKEEPSPDIESIDELQQYALVRLLRKTCSAQNSLRQSDESNALRELANEFLAKYESRRKRPVYSDVRLSNLIQNIPVSSAADFLRKLKSGAEVSVPDSMQALLKTRFSDEGAHLRREIILNCVLPLALCVADESARINLFLWYWSTPALNKYGALSRRFAQFPQNFLWQQQGMLEYLREHGRKPLVVAEAMRDYGFAEILSFYRVGLPPSLEY